MFVDKDFLQNCFVAQIRAKMCMPAGIHAYLREEATPSKILSYEHWNYPKEHAYQFSALRLKLKLDIIEKPENRVHKLTDSNVSCAVEPPPHPSRIFCLVASDSARREDHFQKKICPKRTFPSNFVKLVSKILYLFLAEKMVVCCCCCLLLL